MLIFFYLLWVVLPLFASAQIETQAEFQVPGEAAAESLLYSIEEQAELGLRISSDGQLSVFEMADGRLRQQLALDDSGLSAATQVSESQGLIGVLGRSGQVQILKHAYRLEYPEGGERLISAKLSFPYPDAQLDMGLGSALALREDDDRMTIAVAQQRRIRLKRLEKSSSFFSDSVTLEELADLELVLPQEIDTLLMDPLQEWLYAFNSETAELYFYDIRALPASRLVQTVALAPPGHSLQAVNLLAGGISLVVASSDASISQWFPLRDERGGYSLQKVRQFDAPGDAPVTRLISEQRRRGFMAVDAQGWVGLYYATSEREILQRRLGEQSWRIGAVAPRANTLLLEDAAGRVRSVRIDNEHPEVSWKALWGKIWYESYQEPEHTWQSSSASGDFEPKFSLAPLAFGTLKAAFYAMLFAVPLAIAGAIYTAYFMSSGMRQLVKPTVEVMEALPTVILGFLAGLWLAPFIENYLPGVFLLILLLPLTMPLTGWLWTLLPDRLRHRVPPGTQPALLVLPIGLATLLALGLSKPIEAVFFGGSLPVWLDNEWGITYDQRNSLVVGLAMGFAVIPTIFSIAEDAVFSVPKQLTQGSLALGATPWQTLVRVVLPTASPGIFSALMIGLGRAVGETMIVLMATGNTPIMDMNIFEGFRTLSANIAVEMPESEVGSTHFRILFLAGLVLFLFTFVFNTLAEVIRQRLRMKYSNL